MIAGMGPQSLMHMTPATAGVSAGGGAAYAHFSGAAGQAGDLTARAAQSVVAGAGSVLTSAYGAGVSISESILDGLLDNFGPSGSAVSQLASQLSSTIGGVLNDAVDNASRLVGAGAKAIGTVGTLAAGAGGALAGAGIGAGLGPLGMIGGGAMGAIAGSIAGLIAAKLAATVGEIIGGVLGAAAKAIGAAGELGAGAFRTALTVAKDLMNVTEQWGARVATLQAQTGMSAAGSADVSQRFNALGLGNQLGSLADGMENTPGLYGMRSRFFGLPDYTGRDFLPSLAGRFQQQQSEGPLGQLRARMMTQQLGFDDPQSLRVLSIAPQRLRQQQEEVSNFQGALGFDANKMREASDSIFLFNQRIAAFVDIIKLKIVDTALPYLNQKLEQITAYIAGHADQINAWIQKAVSYLFEELPPAIMRFAGAASTAFGNFLLGVSDFLTGFQAALPGYVQTLDAWLNAGREFVGALAGIGAAVVQLVQNLIARIQNGGLTVTPNTPASTATSGTAGSTAPVLPGGAAGGASQPVAPNSSPLPNGSEFLNTLRTSGIKQPLTRSGFGTFAGVSTTQATTQALEQLETTGNGNSGFGGRLLGTLTGATTGFSSGFAVGARTGVGRAPILVGLAGAVTGAYGGYKLGEEFDAGGERRERLLAQGAGAITGGAAAGRAFRGNPTAVGLGAATGAIGAGRAYDTANERGLIGAAKGGVNFFQGAGDIIGDTWRGDVPGGSPVMEAYRGGRDRFLSNVQPFNYSAQYGASDGPIGKRIGQAAEWTKSVGQGLVERGNQLSNTANEYREMLQELKGINRNTERGADETKGLKNALPGFAQAVGTRAGQLINDEATANLSWSS